MLGCPCPTGSAGTPCAAGSAPAASRRCGWPTTSSSTRRWRSRCSPTTGPRTTRSGSGSSRRAATCARWSRRTSSSVYDAGELDDGRPYLVMSYADQGTLADRLEVEGLTPAQALEVVRQVGAGLQALHDRGILHRDVKPANVLFRTVEGGDGHTVRAMMGDLGLGKALDMSSRLTMIAGTPRFIAPEQAAAEAPDARADQYSLAALAFLLLTGRPPFTYASLSDGEAPGRAAAGLDAGAAVPARGRGGAAPGAGPGPRATATRASRRSSTALTTALGPAAGGPTTQPWLERDPELTQPGPRPTVQPDRATCPSRTCPRAPRPAARRAGRGRAAGAGRRRGSRVRRAARAGPDRADRHRRHRHALGHRARPTGTAPTRPTGGSRPTPTAASSRRSRSARPRAGRTRTRGEGVFVGAAAQHRAARAGAAAPRVRHRGPGRARTAGTATTRRRCSTPTAPAAASPSSGSCRSPRTPLLWVQIRSDDRATANEVLDDVATHGI